MHELEKKGTNKKIIYRSTDIFISYNWLLHMSVRPWQLLLQQAEQGLSKKGTHRIQNV